MNEAEINEILTDLIGTSKVLRFHEGCPIVFLIDENHDNLNNCIQSNIQNAILLIDNAKVVLIGVESQAGGKAWDYKQQRYGDYLEWNFDRDNFIKPYKSRCTTFANSCAKHEGANIIGVECWGMTHKIQADIFEEDSEYYGIDAAEHPLNFERSKHFIQTLFEEYNAQNLNGNLILNCGSNHNKHIEEMINQNEIDSITGMPATYIRINTIN